MSEYKQSLKWVLNQKRSCWIMHGMVGLLKVRVWSKIYSKLFEVDVIHNIKMWFKFLIHTREKLCPILLKGQQSCLSWKSGGRCLINTAVFMECLSVCEPKREEPVSWASPRTNKEFFHRVFSKGPWKYLWKLQYTFVCY